MITDKIHKAGSENGTNQNLAVKNDSKMFFKCNCSEALIVKKKKLKSSLYSRYYVEACNKWRGPSPQLTAWTTQLQKKCSSGGEPLATLSDLTSPGIEPQTSRADSDVFNQ